VREICTLGAMWRGLETGLRQLLNGHEEGNLGYKPRRNLRGTAPVLDPTAAVAVARKLAVLLHRLWVSGEVYEPLRHGAPTAEAA
jgi:hypothetical protein